MEKKQREEEAAILENGLKDTNIVQKSIPLFSLWRSDLGLSEFKILDTYLSRIDSHKPEQRSVRVEKGELEKLLGVTKINKKDLDARLKMLGTPVDLAKGDPRKIHRVSLFSESYATMDENGQWQIILTCTPEAQKYFFNIEQLGYLRYKIRSITSLTSLYSYIMFTYLEFNRFRKSWEVDLAELKEIMNCADVESYNAFKEFNRYILKRCHAEIIEKTETRYTYEPVRVGRKVAKVRFTLETLSDLILGTQSDPDQISLDDYLTAKEGEENLGSISLPGQTNPYDELIELLSAMCNYEFIREEVIVLHETMLALPFDFEDDLARADFISRQYAKLNAQQKRMERSGKKLNNRFAYLQGIIKQTQRVTD